MSAAQTRGGVIGSSRSRTPVAACDGVRDRSRPGDDRRLADALRTERPVGRRHLDDHRVDRRHAVGGRDRVVEERARQQLAVLVVDELLVERPADRLRRAAAHLALDERRVQRPADVLDDHVAEQLHLARLAVDLTWAMCAETEGARLVCAEPPWPSTGS